MKTAVTKRTDTIKNQHNKQEMEKTIFQGKNVQKNKKGEWAGGQAMANGKKKSGKSHKPCDLYPPHTTTQTPRCV